MLRYASGRLLQAAIAILGVLTIVFIVMRFAVPLALAAAILLAAVLYRAQNQAVPAVPVAVSPKPVDYTLLAKLEPPAYEPALRRGSADKAALRFVQAMENYRRRDYAQTIAGLHASLALDSGAAAPRFFLGACELLTGDWDQGTRDLEMVVASGSGPFLEEGLMLLAKASLHRNDPATARRELEQLVASKGDLAPAAGELLRQLDDLSSGQGK